MHIDKIKLTNFRGMDGLDIPLNKQLNIFCGINGIGKSTILDAIVIQLSWLILKIKQAKGSAKAITLNDIKSSQRYSMLDVLYYHNNIGYKSSLLKYIKGGNPKGSKTDFSEVTQLGYNIIESDKFKKLPVIISYSNNRVVNDISLKPRRGKGFDIYETYDRSLGFSTSFSNFFEWFRNREDLENENYRKLSEQYTGDIQLNSVKDAIKEFTGFTISVRRDPLHMQIIKASEKLKVEQLSDGEKSVVALVGDIARRLSIANPESDKPLQGDGIVVIDEIDLHLHPSWQKTIIHKLLKTFPNVQFILSTHSPQVLSEVEATNIFALYKDKDKIKYYKPDQALGLSTSDILEVLMETGSINSVVKLEIDKIFDLIDDDNFTEAGTRISYFVENYGSTPDIIRAEALITMYSNEDI